MTFPKMPSNWDYFAVHSFTPDPELEQLEDTMMDELMAEHEQSQQLKQQVYIDLGLADSPAQKF